MDVLLLVIIQYGIECVCVRSVIFSSVCMCATVRKCVRVSRLCAFASVYVCVCVSYFVIILSLWLCFAFIKCAVLIGSVLFSFFG